MEIHDIDGILIVDRNPFGKGGPGSGRYPAGSSGNSGGRSKGGGGKPSSSNFGDNLESTEQAVGDARDALKDGNVKGAYDKADEALWNADSTVNDLTDSGKLSVSHEDKISGHMDTAERNLDEADQYISKGDHQSAARYVDKGLSAIDKIVEILSTYPKE